MVVSIEALLLGGFVFCFVGIFALMLGALLKVFKKEDE